MLEPAEKPISLPRIGDSAPVFDAYTTQGLIKLDDFKGSWVVLFSHPGDFTPVCTTEIIAMNSLQPELKLRGVELIGLSVDSVNSHIAWIRNIEEKMGVKITFPIIADIDRYVSALYGMIHPRLSKTFTARCVFIIDPKQVIRAILYYPVSIGRSTPEILRIVDALLTADQYSVAIPANWKPGDTVIVPSPGTQKDAEDRLKDNYECLDWYLCKKILE
jgi:peroxiredoxin (alkyl hydroperoxide reductase subunit C)